MSLMLALPVGGRLRLGAMKPIEHPHPHQNQAVFEHIDGTLEERAGH
jgi:hypothetical protein